MTSIDVATQNRWLLGEDVPAATYRMWQAVRVIAGQHVGEVGELISLVSLVPEPVYHLETSNDEDLPVAESELAPVNV